MDKVTVNGVDYFRKSDSSIKIAILQRGWVTEGREKMIECVESLK